MTGRLRARAAVLALAVPAWFGCGAADPAAPDHGIPQRLVIFAPSAAEVVVALGLADRVVAVGSHGPWPPGLETLESAGSFDRPDLERIVELECDLVLTTASVAGNEGYRRIEQLGVAVEALDTSTFEGVFTALARLGTVFGRETRAAELAAEMRGSLARIEAATAELPRKKVLVVVGRDPLYVAGPGSHVDELIRLGGGVNVAHDAASPYQQFSLEAVLERGPEVIADTSGDAAYWSRWPFLPAVRHGNVYRVEPDVLVIPGMRLPEMARAMAEMIHPGTFEPAAEE